MPSSSGADYRGACAEYLTAALLRPRMYFESLPPLESALGGHETAYAQLGLIGEEESFNKAFGAWLRRAHGVSGAAGWARAIMTLADRQGVDAETLFATEVRSFLREWATCPPRTSASE